jgi:ribosomal protein S18 acetylase RimI-like enzyme
VAFRVAQTSDDRFDEAFAVLHDVAVWLETLGRRQRITAITRDRYAEWQSKGQNHVVLDGSTVAGIFTVCEEQLTDWLESVPNTPLPFLRALATHPHYRGQGVGAIATQHAIRQVAPEVLYLDCVSDFLPSYYTSVGFHEVARQVRSYSDGDYDITLMASHKERVAK